MTTLQTILAFFLAIGPLIIFHELGHYWVARLCGVKVLRFSLGLGKVVWSRRFGPDQTEWAISMLPLGGYVKMLDNRDPATAATNEVDAQREFTRQNVWKRIAIVAAGPIFNFILAIVVFSGLYMYGMKDAPTLVRAMSADSAVYQAGVRGGDQILTVNGEVVPGWSDLRWAVLQAVIDKAELRLDVAQAGGGRYSATVPAAVTAAIDLESDILGNLGLVPQLSPAVVGEPIPDGPARRAGILSGDVIVSIDGKRSADNIDVITMVRASGGRTIAVGVLRGGAPMTIAVTPEIDPLGKHARINAPIGSQPQTVIIPNDAASAIVKGVRGTWDRSVLQLKMIGKIITAQLSPKSITGPFTIGEFAGKAARAGVIEFLTFVALISISLGVMNLLPIPVLDGGLLLYYSLEVLTGRPLPERFIDIAQRVGVVMLVMLMSLALFNDAVRHL